MSWITARLRITFGLTCLLLSVLLLSMLVGVLPDRTKAVLEGRRALCEAIAVDCSLMASQQDVVRLQTVLKVIVDRNPDILSAALRRNNGDLLAEAGDHRSQWNLLDDERSADTQVQVPICAGSKRWGNIEICFRPVGQKGWLGFFFGPQARLLWFACGTCFVFFFYYMKKMLDYLDPSQAVPGHVRSALDTLAEGLLVIDGRDRIVLANEAFAGLLGTSADKLVGHIASGLPWIRDREDTPNANLPWIVAMREKTVKTNVAIRLQTVSVGRRTFMVNSSPVLGSKGEYRGVLASFDDVTELEEKEFQLRRAVESADAANRTKSEFLANMSHEIRTPMNAILGFTDVLRRGFADDESTRRQYLDTIHSSGKHLLELINDILDLSKIEAGRLEVERKPCSPCALISELVTMFGVPAQERSIFLDFAIDGAIPETILSDPTRMRQIIANLLGNAIKFTERGGVKIVARLSADGGKPQLAIDVIDSGIGISPDGLEKIFEPFVQADNTVTRRFGGTGLGLTISRRFAAALGGQLTVASEVGKGSTFTVTVDTGPLEGVRLIDATDAKASLASPANRAANALPALPPARVLVVDDGEANRQLITVVLTRAGLQVESAENGEVAVRMATSGHFDLILMDMQMPVMDGYTATETLRRQGVKIPIVALTASVMKGSEGRCGAVGCTAYVSKPVDIDQLMRCLAEQLQGFVPAREAVMAANGKLDEPSSVHGQNADAQFISFVKEQLNAMHFALHEGQLAMLGELAAAMKPSAEAVGQGEFYDLATRLEQLTEQEAIDDIEETICELAILSESISLRTAQRVAVATDPVTTSPLPSHTTPARRAALVSTLPMDDPDFLRIVVGFVPRLREQALAMQAAWARADCGELASLAHWLKGAGGTVGFDILTQPAKALELAAMQQEPAAIDAALKDVLDRVDSISLGMAEINRR